MLVSLVVVDVLLLHADVNAINITDVVMVLLLSLLPLYCRCCCCPLLSKLLLVFDCRYCRVSCCWCKLLSFCFGFQLLCPFIPWSIIRCFVALYNGIVFNYCYQAAAWVIYFNSVVLSVWCYVVSSTSVIIFRMHYVILYNMNFT